MADQTKRNNKLTNATEFLPKASSPDMDLTRAQRIELEQANIRASIPFITSDDIKNQDTNTKDNLTSRMSDIEAKAKAASPNIKQEIEDHDSTVQKAKDLKLQSYDKTVKKDNTVDIEKISAVKEQPLDLNFKKKYALDQNGNYRYSFNTKKVAFQDKGKKIVINSTSKETHEDVVKLLASKGAEKIKVSGLTSVKEGIWMAAQDRGIEVVNFEPSIELKERYEQSKNTVTILPKEDKNTKDKSLVNNIVAASKVAESKLNPANHKVFTSFVNKALQTSVTAGHLLSKIRITNKSKEAAAEHE